MIETSKEMMDINTFLGIYGITKSKYYAEVNKNRLKVTRNGGRIYIKRKDADEWLSNFGDD